MRSLMETEQQPLLQKIHEQDAQLLADKRELDSKEQVIRRLENRIQEERIAKEHLKAEQKRWQEEQEILVQEKKSFQQEKQQWVQQNEELKEEWKQQQQKIHDLDQQLQEKSKERRCLEERNEVLMRGIVYHFTLNYNNIVSITVNCHHPEASHRNAEMGQLKTKNRKLSEENEKQAKGS